ncbi:MAG: hypothetical protein ABI910_00790 [Gemmatimonadota bacterium]
MPLLFSLMLGVLGGVSFPPSEHSLSSPVPPQHVTVAPDTVTLLGYHAEVPSGWVARTPSSSMRLAEFATGATGPAADVVAYYFGPAQGGSIDDNLTRWKEQFSNPDGSELVARVTRETSGPFPLTIAEYRGTYARGIGAGSSADKALPDHALIAVITETPKGTLFFQMYGPAAVVASQRERYLAFVRGLQ